MSTTNDGGPAFPYTYGPDGAYHGMSLRDWFAGQAINAMLSKSHGDQNIVARGAYIVADAMLKARSENPSDLYKPNASQPIPLKGEA